MQTSFPSRSPDSRHPRRVKRSRRGSQASCTHTARPCAASEKTAVASLPDHKKNRQPRFNRNQQYSITALTDGGGIIKERYAYSAYGTPTILDVSGIARTTSAENNHYTYTGREWDEALRLYHYRARIYDPIAGRFCSRDPIGYEGSPWNLYEYVEARPLSNVDPSGMASWASCDAACMPIATATAINTENLCLAACPAATPNRTAICRNLGIVEGAAIYATCMVACQVFIPWIP